MNLRLIRFTKLWFDSVLIRKTTRVFTLNEIHFDSVSFRISTRVFTLNEIYFDSVLFRKTTRVFTLFFYETTLYILLFTLQFLLLHVTWYDDIGSSATVTIIRISSTVYQRVPCSL